MNVAEDLRRRKGFIFPANKKEYCGMSPCNQILLLKKKGWLPFQFVTSGQVINFFDWA